ncbi:MAG: hypothetical protein ACK58L_15140, partial [Planctomycetota bacterium]
MANVKDAASVSSASAEQFTPAPTLRSDGLVALFSTTVFLSAFLLFQVQPMMGKAILPWFGGTPGVWTTCMLVFQFLLCAGYLYSHLLTSRISRRKQLSIHCTLLIVSVVLLRLRPEESWKPVGTASPALQILGLLLFTAGLPYFALSTTGPLLLHWFARTRPQTSPHRLYALSNAGSLLALLSYPFLVEPTMPLTTQATLWSIIYGLFCVLCMAAAVASERMTRAIPSGHPVSTGTTVRPLARIADPLAAAPAGRRKALEDPTKA